MPPIEIQLNPSIERIERERLDIVPGVPPFLPNQENGFQLDPQTASINSDFSSVSRRVIFQLRTREEAQRLIYVPYTSDDDSPPPVEVGGSRGLSSGGGVEGLEEQAIEGVEELLDEADGILDQLENGDWVRVDSETGYEYVDPEFYVLYERLLALLNAVQLLGLIIDALASWRKQASETFDSEQEKAKSGDDDSSASEILAVTQQSGTLKSQGKLLNMIEEVTTHNQALLQDRINRARANASASWYDSASWWYDHASEVVTSGGSDACQRHEDKRAAEVIYRETQRYENFMQGVQAEYERVLTNPNLYDDELAPVSSVFQNMTWDNLVVDIDAGKVDIDRNRYLASQMYLSSPQNYRRIYMLIQLAKQELKEIAIGKKTSNSTKQVLQGVFEGLEKFESMVFSALSYQLQSSIAAQNLRVESYNDMKLRQHLYYSSISGGLAGWSLTGIPSLIALAAGEEELAVYLLSPVGGSTPLLGGVFRNVTDWAALEYLNATIDSRTYPTQLSMDEVYRILADLYGTSMENVRRDIESGDKYIRRIEQLEAREWDIIGRLNEGSIVYTADDGFQGIYESQVNALREELRRVQDCQREIIMYLEGIMRLRKIVIYLSTGLGSMEVGDDTLDAFKAGLESRTLAFDLKYTGIKNEVEAHNKALQQSKTLTKARWVAASSGVLAGVAAVLIFFGIVCAVPTGGASIVGALMVVSAMGQLGASLSQIVYNKLNPVDDEIYDQTDFYQGRVRDSIEQSYNEQIDLLSEHSHVDGEDSSDPLSAGDQWVKDTRLFMQVRNKLTNIYIYEQILLMYAKADADQKSIAAGVYTGDSFGHVRASSSDRYDQKLKTYDLKEEMVEDIISRRNLAVAQDTELNWAYVNAGMSIVQVVTFGMSKFLDAGTKWQVAMKWTNWGADMTAMTVQAVKHLLDANSGYGELGEYDAIKEAIEAMVEASFDGFDRDTRLYVRQTLRDSLRGVNEDEMLDSIGMGRVSADAARYYEGVRAIQQMYNRIIIMLRVAEGIGRARARIVGAPTPTESSQIFEAEKANFLKQLDLLNERVQAYVERTNAMADAWRQLVITSILILFHGFLKLAEVKGWRNELKAGASSGVDKGIKKAAKMVGKEVKSTDWTVTDDVELGNKIGQTFGADQWSRTLGVSTVVNLGIDVALHPQTVKFVTQLAYDRSKRGERSSKKVGDSTGQTTYALSASRPEESSMDQLENQSYDNQLHSARSGVQGEEITADAQFDQELTDFWTAQVDAMPNSIIDESWKGAATWIDINREEFQERVGTLMAKVDWKSSQSVERFLHETQRLVSELASESKDTLVSEAEKKLTLTAEAADQAAKQLAKDPALRQKAVEHLKGLVEGQLKSSSPDKALMAYAAAILERVSKQEGAPITEGEMTALGARVAAKAMLTAVPRSAEKVKAKEESPPILGEAIHCIHAEAEAIKAIAKEKGTKPDAKESRIAECFKKIKKALTQLIRSDASIVGIDLSAGPEAERELSALLQSINESSPAELEEMADKLQGLKDNPELAKKLTPTQRQLLDNAIASLRSASREMKDEETIRRATEEVEEAMPRVAALLDSIKARQPGRADRLERKFKERGLLVNDIPQGSDSDPDPVLSIAMTGRGGQGPSYGGSHQEQKQDEFWQGWEEAVRRLPQKSGTTT